MKAQNIDSYCEIYDKMWIVEQKAEDHRERVGAIVARLFEQTTDMEMEFIKAEVFGVDDGAPIMAKDHPALQELFKLNAGEQLSPVLCLVLFKDSQRYHFYYLSFICRREI